MKTNLQKILDHALNGGKFQYLTYDHKSALTEFKGTKEYQDLCQYDLMLHGSGNPRVDKYSIPKEIRGKHPLWRNGKIRNVEFAPDGHIRRIKIGAKFALNFYENDIHKLRLL
jgi:hypothetical protein